jgi:hypothetical protein
MADSFVKDGFGIGSNLAKKVAEKYFFFRDFLLPILGTSMGGR